MDDFFTLTSFATLTGSVVAVVVIVNALRHALNWGPKWFGLVVSILIAFIAYSITINLGDEAKTTDLGWIRYFTILVNGCMIYTSAFGIQNTVVASNKPDDNKRSLGANEEGGISFQGVDEDNLVDNGKLTFRKQW